MRKILPECSCFRRCLFGLLSARLVIMLLTMSLVFEIQARDKVFRPDIAVQGTVTSEAGTPMPGVNVILKGTTNGTSTDSDGKYSLNVPEGEATLIFSFIGYATQELTVNGRTVIDVVLLEDVSLLSDVVVVGYGTQNRKDM